MSGEDEDVGYEALIEGFDLEEAITCCADCGAFDAHHLALCCPCVVPLCPSIASGFPPQPAIFWPAKWARFLTRTLALLPGVELDGEE